MTQSLVINGKEYIPTNVLALRFNYSSDYIGKLAREEKILGTLIGRQWFVEPESLNFFLQKAEVEKKLRQEELRRQRKLEHLAHQKLVKEERVSLADELMALGQTAAIVLCGLFVCGIGWIVSAEDLGIAELESGLTQSVAFIGSAIIPTVQTNNLASAIENTYVAPAVVPEVEESSLVFTTLPEFPPRMPLSTSSSEKVGDSFSDEVRVVSSKDGDVIVPVFREGDGIQQFLLIPVNAADQ